MTTQKTVKTDSQKTQGTTMKTKLNAVKDWMNTPLTLEEINRISDTLNVKQKGLEFIAKHMKDRLEKSPKTKKAINKILKGSWSIVSFIVESFTIGLMSPALVVSGIVLGVSSLIKTGSIANKWVFGGALTVGCIAYGALLAFTPAGAFTSMLTVVGIYATFKASSEAFSCIKSYFSKK